MQDEIRILIVEDEELWAKSLQSSLEDFGFSVCGLASDFETAILALNRKDYDLVLLDIHLQGKESGIELGRMVHMLYQKPFIFVTASLDPATVQAAITASPSAYLTKPVHPASLFATIQTALNNFSKQVTAQPSAPLQEDSFFVKQGEKYRKLNWKDIVALRSEKNYTGLLNSIDGTTAYIRSTFPKTLRYLLPAHLQPDFVQVNRGEAVQLRFIKELSKDEVVTAFGNFAVTESYTKALREKLPIIG